METYKGCIDGIIKKSKMYTEEDRLKCLSFIDLTSLSEQDSPQSIREWISKINDLDKQNYPHIAAVCVYPTFISEVKHNITNSNIKIASVVAGFPSSQTFWEIKLAESLQAIKAGANELDMVISVGRFLSKDYNYVQREIGGMKSKIGKITLKVILETGVLKTNDQIRKASEIAIEAGANFIKTSTGKTGIGATPEAVWTMCQCIKEYYNRTGNRVGIKVSGGIRQTEDAMLYINIVKTVLGEDWIDPALFRIGASSLINSVLEKNYFKTS